VLENIYTGPHAAHVPKRFAAAAAGQAQAAAALGCAVVFIDGRGTGLRSRAFRARRGSPHLPPPPFLFV
jgi:hypothetical protein